MIKASLNVLSLSPMLSFFISRQLLSALNMLPQENFPLALKEVLLFMIQR